MSQSPPERGNSATSGTVIMRSSWRSQSPPERGNSATVVPRFILIDEGLNPLLNGVTVRHYWMRYRPDRLTVSIPS